MKNENIFSIPIYHDYANKELITLVENELADKNLFGQLDDVQPHILLEKELSNTAIAVYTASAIFLENLGIKKANIEIVASTLGSKEHLLDGVESDLTVLFFTKVGATSGKITLHPPTPIHKLSPILRHSTYLSTQDVIHITPESAKIIVFPSFLRKTIVFDKASSTNMFFECLLKATIG